MEKNGELFYSKDVLKDILSKDTVRGDRWLNGVECEQIDSRIYISEKYLDKLFKDTNGEMKKIIPTENELKKLKRNKIHNDVETFRSFDKKKKESYQKYWQQMKDSFLGEDENSFPIFAEFLLSHEDFVIKAIRTQESLMKKISLNYYLKLKDMIDVVILKIKRICNISIKSAREIKILLKPVEQKLGFEFFPLKQLMLDKTSTTVIQNDAIQYINLQTKLEEWISKIGIENLTSSFSLILVIMGDACKWSFNNNRLSFVSTFRSPYLSDKLNLMRSRDQTYPIFVSSGKDDHSNMKKKCSQIFKEISELETKSLTTTNKIEYKSSVVYVGDHMFRIGLMGHSGPSSTYGNPYSILPSTLYGAWEYFGSFNLTKRVREHILQTKSKENFGVVGEMLVDTEITNIIPGPFHEICRLILTTMKWTVILAQMVLKETPLLKELMDSLKELGIGIEGDTYVQVTGNSGRKCAQILKQVVTLLEYFSEPSKTPLKFLWKECSWLVDFITKPFPSRDECNDYYYHAICYGQIMSAIFCNEAITVTIRIIVDLNTYWVAKYSSLGLFNEESIESNHVLQNFIERNCTTKCGGKGHDYETNRTVLLLDEFHKITTQELKQEIEKNKKSPEKEKKIYHSRFSNTFQK